MIIKILVFFINLFDHDILRLRYKAFNRNDFALIRF